MKFSIKAILISAFSSLTVLTAVLYSTSCNTDRCKTIICSNSGVCNNGACTCLLGYEGTNCETVTRKKFTGNWSVFEKGSVSLAKQYQINITDGETITDLNINNFNNYFHHPVMAKVVGDRIIIPNQRLDGKIIVGDGYIYSNVTYGQYGGINMKYFVQDSATLIKDDYGYEAQLDFSDASAWNK